MKEIISYLQEFNILSITVRLLLSLFCGLIIGVERSRKGHEPGGRTYAVVCVASCLAMLTGLYLCQDNISSDPARIAAQVVSGIGFLGAGSILVIKNQHIKGLTTAAGLWAAGCIGIANGAGFYIGAILASLILLILLLVGKKTDEE